MAVGTTKVVQVTNIAPQATKDQMHILFGYLGKIEDIRLYPTIRDVSCPVQSRICYIKFVDPATVGIAQHMTNTVFIDRALIVIPISSGDIPDEYYSLEMTRNGTIVPGLTMGEPKLPPHVSNIVYGSGSDQVILTRDPNLEQNDLAPYPPLPATYDAGKIEETRRTIIMLNVDSSYSNDTIIDFFSAAGEVKYLRTCKRESDGSSHMLIEFTDQPSVINALKLNGTELKGNPVEIQHATQPITKPQAKSNEAAQKEIEEAMSRFKEAQNMINASIEPVIGMLTKDKRSSRRSRSRSRGRRRRSRSRSHSRRRSRSRRSRSRRRTKSRERRRRSKSRSGRRSRSRSRRSGSRSSKTRRSRSKSRRRRSRDRSPKAKSRDRKSRERSKDRKRTSRDKDRKSRDRERESKEKSKEKTSRESKEKRSEKENSIDVNEKKRSRSRSKSRRRSRSRERKKDRRRSRSRGSRRRSPTPHTSRRRSRSRSKDRKRDKKNDKKDKDRDRKGREKRSRSRSRSARSRSTRSHSKVPRNYDEEEKGFDADKEKAKELEMETPVERGSPEKSDNMDISNSP